MGAYVRAGNDVDAFALMCAPVTGLSVGIGSMNVKTGTVTASGWAGNIYGGNPYTLTCPAGYAVTGARGTYTGSLNAIQMRCSRIGGDGVALTQWGGTPRYGAQTPSYDINCLAGIAATAFSGRSGLLIDGIRLHCQ